MRTIFLAACVASLCSCATSFTGSSRVEGGVKGCRDTCKQWGMELTGMVKMGEYSDGCICETKQRVERTSAGAASSLPAVVGVHLQMEAERQRAMQQPQPPPQLH
jgi:hypothetical protein